MLITLFFILTPVCGVFKYYTWFKFSLRSLLALSVRKNRILFFFLSNLDPLISTNTVQLPRAVWTQGLKWVPVWSGMVWNSFDGAVLA